MRLMRRAILLGCVMVLSPLSPVFPSPPPMSVHVLVTAEAPIAVLTQRYDNNRSGANLNETVLNTRNVNVDDFGLVFTRTVEGQVYAQPLYVSNLPFTDAVSGQVTTHNAVFVATMHNDVYAFDADDPAASTPLWHVNFGPSAPVPNLDFGNRLGSYSDIAVEVGIVSTPVIDLSTGTIYVVALTKEYTSDGSYQYHHRLHALDLTTGREKDGGPVDITASAPGAGYDSVDGTIAFSNTQQLQRPALLLSNGVVYVAFGSYADTDPYHGWVLGYDASTLRLVSVFDGTANGNEGGIWQSGWGPSADAGGNVYVVTGNGTWDAMDEGGDADYGDSVVKLGPVSGATTVTNAMTVSDWFTPYNQEILEQVDADLGSSGALLITGTNLLVTGSKAGTIYVVDRTNLGHFNPDGDSQIVQSFAASFGQIYGSVTYWNGPGGLLLYTWGVGDYLKAFRFDGSLFDTTPAYTSTMPAGYPGGMLSLSANGSAPGSGILWASHPYSGDGGQSGILQAFDASNVSHELWDSKQDVARDDLGTYAKFNAPTVADGKVYVGTFSGYLAVYGLLPPPPPTDTPTSSATATPSDTATATPTITPTHTPTPTHTGTATPTHTPTPTQTTTATPTATPTSSATATTSPPSSATPTTTPTEVPSMPTATATAAPSNTATSAASATKADPVSPSATATRTAAPTQTPRPQSETHTSVSIPRPWLSRDIGAVTRHGSASYALGSFMLRGSGHDIWSTADAFLFAYQPLHGDGTITARVVQIDAADAWAKAGVMMRVALTATSAHAMTVLTSRKGASLQYRAQMGRSTVATPGPPTRAPYWVRLTRRGGTVTAYVSGDGTRWSRIRSAPIALHGSVYVGLVVTSHNAGALCLATFDHVTVTSATAAPSRNASKRSTASRSRHAGMATTIGKGLTWQ